MDKIQRAKRVKKGVYIYRGHKIEYFDYKTLGDPECKETQWNVYPPNQESWVDYGFTLSHAKRVVDELIEQK